MLFDVNLSFKIDAIPHLHKLVRITGVAVLARELAATVRIDCPCKWHPRRCAAVQERTRGKGEVLDIMTFSQRFALCGEARDANKFRVLRLGKNGQGCHPRVRLLFAKSKSG